MTESTNPRDGKELLTIYVDYSGSPHSDADFENLADELQQRCDQAGVQVNVAARIRDRYLEVVGPTAMLDVLRDFLRDRQPA